MVLLHTVAFSIPKAGNSTEEWEDGVGVQPGKSSTRIVMVDGAAAAYDPQRWGRYLVRSFLRGDPAGPLPALDRDSLGEWFVRLQRQWVDDTPTTFRTVFDERLFRQNGSFATFLGCEISGLRQDRPRWRAVALGDTVMFHVRDGHHLTHVPPLAASDFGTAPLGVHTRPECLDRMVQMLCFEESDLEVGDLLFLATDALAQWMLRQEGGEAVRMWNVLGLLDHPATFDRMIGDLRAARQLKNDDVTLLRVNVVADPPELLLVCL